MISSIRNPWIRRPLVVLCLPFMFALDALLSVLITGCDWWVIARRSWRGPVNGR